MSIEAPPGGEPFPMFMFEGASFQPTEIERIFLRYLVEKHIQPKVGLRATKVAFAVPGLFHFGHIWINFQLILTGWKKWFP